MNIWYKDYSEYLSELFPGEKMQKISVNAGFGCPNRDGTVGEGGCIYCNNESFSPAYCHEGLSVKSQIESGKEFFARKYPKMKYLAYFQNFTGTYGRTESLRSLYLEALECEGVEGLIVGTRPDCVPDNLLEVLADINREKPVILEFGAETTHNRTLSLINRGHTWEQTEECVRKTSAAGISCGLHFIMGLPGETEKDMLLSVERAVSLPVSTLKFHHLQVLRGTKLHRMIETGEIESATFTKDEYLDLCIKIIGKIPRNIAVERFLASSPPGLVVAPKWGLKNHEFTNLLHNRLKKMMPHDKIGSECVIDNMNTKI